jgi:hypothetical protein
MNTLTKLALGLIGQNKPLPLSGPAAALTPLPPPSRAGGMPLMEALQHRQSQRNFSTQPLSEQLLSDLLWAAAGVNRPAEGGRTAPSALHAQEVDLHVALPNGLPRSMRCAWRWPVTCGASPVTRTLSTRRRWT